MTTPSYTAQGPVKPAGDNLSKAVDTAETMNTINVHKSTLQLLFALNEALHNPEGAFRDLTICNAKYEDRNTVMRVLDSLIDELNTRVGEN
ncbi:MAG TPA: hypothetical protein VNZ45_15470 [Bacteroidia bacterium]|jgi:hypothetical protein|nr:hypothetical protein [Bacteroidia bacterium]